MSTRSTSNGLVSPLSNPESVIRNRRRNLGEPSLLIDFEEIIMNPNNNLGPPPAGPIPQNHNGPPGPNPQNSAPDLRTMEVLCQPTMNDWGGPIAPITIHAMDFRLKNHMIQQVQNSCQFHGLPGDDANKHLDKFLTVTQCIKQNGVTNDALRLYLFPYSLTHHATAWFDRLPKNSIHTFKEMVSKFLSKYFPPSMVTKLRDDICNFRQLPDESLFEAQERYKLSVDRCPNRNMLPVTQIDTFYNGLTLRHRGIINAAAGGTFMKRRPEECYDLIKNMTAHHNDWDTLAQMGESSRSITFSSPEIAALTQQVVEMSKKILRMCQSNQQVNMVNLSCETCGGLHHYFECQAAGGFTQGDEVERDPEPTMDKVHNSSSKSIARVPSLMFKKLHFNISLVEALALIPKYAKILKDLLTNKEKLLEMANTPLNENCSSIILKKLPKKLRDPKKFLIHCDFSKIEKCMALADLAEDVFMQVGKFKFPADFVFVDYDVDPRIPFILGRQFLRMARALVDVHKEELILRVNDELAHIISPPEYDHFYFDIEIDLGELTRLLKENISSSDM
nr:reverse transcriptase domain-containing protein [Tanacetum cinerariifolium]